MDATTVPVLTVGEDAGISDETRNGIELSIDHVPDVAAGRRRLDEVVYDHVVVSSTVTEAVAFARSAVERPATGDVLVTGPETEPALAAELSRTNGVEYAPRDALADRDESLIERVLAVHESADQARLRRSLVAFIGDGVYATDADGRFRLVNPAFASLTGYDRETLLGKHVSAVVCEADVETGRDHVRDLLADPERSSATYRATVQQVDGGSVPVEVSLTLDRADAGPPGTVGVVRDLQHRQHRQQRLERYETIVETAPVGAFMVDENGSILDHDDRSMEMLGLADGPYVGQSFADLVADGLFGPGVLDEYLDLVRHLLSSSNDETTGVLDVETTVDGEPRYFEAHVGLLPYEESFNGVAGILDDVTERRRWASELESERSFVDSLLNTLPDVFYVLDETGQFARWNDRLSEVTGYDDDELAEMHATEVVPPADRETIAEAMSQVYREGTAEHRESHILTADGEQIAHRFSGNRVEDADGTVQGLVGTAREITERKRRERRLTVLRRVLRHNIRTDVTLLRGAGTRMAEQTGNSELRRAGETVREVATELAELSETARLIENAIDRGQVSPGASTSARSVVTELVAEYDSPDTAATVEAVVETDAAVRADDRLATALDQLVDNAVEHGTVPDGDRATVTVRCRRVDDAVEFVVLDDGPGIDEPELLAAADDPDITQLNHTSGLGLWLVRWLVRMLEGSFEIGAGDAGGTVARVRIPLAG